MLGNHPPEGAGIWRADGFALEHNRGIAMNQWGIADIGMPNHPADIRRGPEHIAGIHVIDVLHSPLQSHQMSSSGADHALWSAGCPRGV